MKRLVFPNPPNPGDAQFRNPMAFNQALYQWAMAVKGALEQTININGLPARPPFVPTAYSTQTTITGTSSLVDVANCLCSLIAALNNKGITTPNVPDPTPSS